jgi:hypothetical protein
VWTPWNVRFEWTGAALTGRTGTGRVTQVLAINEPDFLAMRETLVKEGVFPLE